MNRLGQERSPYLLQHAENPVDWYPWGQDAFERARRDDRPIFLSIGYSTCHWCHVMEHESFENPAIADLLNRDFVSIKVDREERPDVDRVYMSFVQATTGSGGWPMTVFLTPELKPFFGGTYFPPSSRWGRPGFADLLGELARVWREDRQRVEGAAAELLKRLRGVTGTDGSSRAESQLAPASALDTAVEQFRAAFDERRGGFGDAPKFPRPSELLFLLREHARRAAAGVDPGPALRMATETLRAMALGGMRDHIGGGFHRYSVDGDWRVPHFEKMLYDQAQLVLAYLEAAQATGDAFYAAVAEDTLDYVRRDMTDPGGGFYSAEDADSLPPDQVGVSGAHKSEGAFYIWSDEEVEGFSGRTPGSRGSGSGSSRPAMRRATPRESSPARTCCIPRSPSRRWRVQTGRPVEDVAAALSRIRDTLFAERQERPRPHLDDKVLTAWNGLMIAAFARAARVLVDRPVRRDVISTRRPGRRPSSGTRCGSTGGCCADTATATPAIEAYAEDYAFLIWGLLELFQAGGDPQWLEWALTLQAQQDDKFWDDTGRRLVQHDRRGSDGSSSAQGRLRRRRARGELHRRAERAHDLASDRRRRSPHRAERTLARYGPRIGAAGRSIPMMLCALSAWHAGLSQVVVVGPRDRARPLLEELARHYVPFAIVIPVAHGNGTNGIGTLLPFAAAMTDRGSAAAYVCRDFTCRQPVTTVQDLAAQL